MLCACMCYASRELHSVRSIQLAESMVQMGAGSGWYCIRVVSWKDLPSKLAVANSSSVLYSPLLWSHFDTPGAYP